VKSALHPTPFITQVRGWEKYPWLRHGFSTRQDGFSTVYSGSGCGELNLGYTNDDDPAFVSANRELFRSTVAPDSSELVLVRQVHGTLVKQIAAGETGLMRADGRAAHEADGLMTDVSGVLLAVQAADCVPVLVADTRLKVVAAFHAGWRGTAAGMVEQGIAGMVREYGCRPDDLIAAVGPAIGVCCYTVGDEVRNAFAVRFSYAAELSSGQRIDLWEANRRQLLGAGIPEAAISVVGECTACTRLNGSRKYFSHRDERGFTGRAVGAIAIAN
jgi:polyphenol oxidase